MISNQNINGRQQASVQESLEQKLAQLGQTFTQMNLHNEDAKTAHKEEPANFFKSIGEQQNLSKELEMYESLCQTLYSNSSSSEVSRNFC